MKIIFKTNYLSIEEFTTVEAGDFIILTWKNGTWKTHLLKAIKEWKVEIEWIDMNKVVYFDYMNFNLQDEPNHNANSIFININNIWTFLNQIYNDWVMESVLVEDIRAEKEKLWNNYNLLCEVANKKGIWLFMLSKEDINNQEVFNLYKNYKQNIEALIRTRGGNTYLPSILLLARKIPFSIDELSREQFEDECKFISLKDDFLPYSLWQSVYEYYSRYVLNFFRLNHKDKIIEDDYRWITEEDFIKKYWEEPWIIINEIFSNFPSFSYIVKSPIWKNFHDNFVLELIDKNDNNVKPIFSQLSSWEKIILALVASIYKASCNEDFPEVLLLDEIDASLHPSMIQSLLKTIYEVFISRWVKVILATHSPTTIALSNEDDIFIMNKQWKNRIEKKWKEEALDILTEWFITLEKWLRILDEVSKKDISIITEWYNTKIIRKALELYWVKDVEVIEWLEQATWKNQLKTLFNFFTKFQHNKKIIFVFDCDVDFNLEEDNNTFSFTFKKNQENLLCNKWIENLFSESCFDWFTKKLETANKEVTIYFDEQTKTKFAEKLFNEWSLDDFKLFEELVNYINEVRKK